ncbi:MAG: alanine racemase [Fibrobacteria bacterium]|nr:alanine racemase [Fibrobacteria bacterium]
MKKSPLSPRVWLEVDLSAIRSNFRQIEKHVKPASVMVVLKANAYGLGIEPIAKALAKAGVARIGVAEVREAEPLIKSLNIPIHVLGGLTKPEIPAAVALGIICPVTSYETALAYSKEAGRQHKQAKVHYLIDTGMGRLGIPANQAVKIIRRAKKLPNMVSEGIYSHFSNANNPHHPKSKEQLALFKDILSQFNKEPFAVVHMANSDAINNFRPSFFNMVRTGINLYGVFDLEGRRACKLRPTLALKSCLIAKRILPAGHTIGYGCTHVLFKDTLVGTVPAGYADGIPMSASNSASVLIGGIMCPVIGRVSMDYITVDLSANPHARLGTTVVIVGKSGKKEITVEDWARIKQSHPYDIICSLGNRVARVYLNE